ncbi:LuxR C-terminal-related transcriptional regulator [Nocardia thailandica]|uniref:LuxR C-terminal-related transcriptional regulator n=1 Tax=Nocardia thailandica TaxID=257275 RepID=A0ABW6PUK8_9NOCA|nr:response regulator transcription factor [Nocardia thailandica]
MPRERTLPLSLAVIDDHPLVHDGIRAWCAEAELPVTITDFAHPDAFLAAGPAADAVVLDLRYGPGGPDLDAVSALCARGLRVVVLSGDTDADLVLDCLDRGVVGYLSKAEGPGHFAAAIRAALGDEPYQTPTMVRAMHLGRSAARPRLSDRERQVLLAWFRTESKSLTAAKLHISVSTVETHLARIRAKYATVGRPAPTKAALVARAIADNLITAEDL